MVDHLRPLARAAAMRNFEAALARGAQPGDVGEED